MCHWELTGSLIALFMFVHTPFLKDYYHSFYSNTPFSITSSQLIVSISVIEKIEMKRSRQYQQLHSRPVPCASHHAPTVSGPGVLLPSIWGKCLSHLCFPLFFWMPLSLSQLLRPSLGAQRASMMPRGTRKHSLKGMGPETCIVYSLVQDYHSGTFFHHCPTD